MGIENKLKDYASAVIHRDSAQSLAGRIASGEIEPREARAIAAQVEKLFMFLSEFVPAEVKRAHALRVGKTGEGEGPREALRGSASCPPSPRMYA